jgi:hypothetical protein
MWMAKGPFNWQYIIGGISLGQKWWRVILEIEISCNQWEGSACTQSALILFSFKFWVGGKEDFFSFFLCSQHVPFKFPMGSHQVLNMFSRFPMCSPRTFPIAPHFNPISFAQSPPVLTYITGPKGEALQLPKESSTLGSLHSFNLVLWWANQIGSQKKRLDLWGTPN